MIGSQDETPTLKESKQNVRGNGTFVSFIKHDDGVPSDIRINDTFSLQHTVRHELDLGLGACAILETDRIPDLLAQPTAHFFCHSLCDRHGGNTTRLRTTNLPALGETCFCEVLDDLRGLPGSRVSDDDKDLVLQGSSVKFSANRNERGTHLSNSLQQRIPELVNR